MPTKIGRGNDYSRDFNSTHPEMEKGEMLLTNIAKNDPYEYKRIGWSTKRKGQKAYDIGGAVVPFLEPVFVQRKEYEEGMKKYE
jgi:hypothetical protein